MAAGPIRDRSASNRSNLRSSRSIRARKLRHIRGRPRPRCRYKTRAEGIPHSPRATRRPLAVGLDRDIDPDFAGLGELLPGHGLNVLRRLDPRTALLALVEFSHVIVIDGVKNAINGLRLHCRRKSEMALGAQSRNVTLPCQHALRVVAAAAWLVAVAKLRRPRIERASLSRRKLRIWDRTILP
jgi:hypothetical protein